MTMVNSGPKVLSGNSQIVNVSFVCHRDSIFPVIALENVHYNEEHIVESFIIPKAMFLHNKS